MKNQAPQGAKDNQVGFLSPLAGLLYYVDCAKPMTYVMGYTISPLTGLILALRSQNMTLLIKSDSQPINWQFKSL
jgi:hypothetical protein